MLALLVWKGRLLSKYKKTIFICGIGGLVFAVPWDSFAIASGLWSFPQQSILGFWFFGLPLEEWIFISFICMEIAMLALIFTREYDG